MTYADMTPHVAYLIGKQCEMVGCDPHTFDFSADRWFTVYKWTDEQQVEFKQWIATELATNKMLRKGFGISSKSRKYLLHLADWWMLMYGWSTKLPDASDPT